MKKTTTLILISFALTMIGCGDYRNLKNADDESFQAQGTTSIDFATIRERVLEPNCTNCHQPEGRHQAYANYSVVRADAPNMLREMESGRMPKFAPRLPEETIALFREWVEAGAPEFSDQEQGAGTPNATLSFNDLKTGVFDKYKCTSCHVHYKDYNQVRLSIGSIVSLVQSNEMPIRRTAFEEPPSPVSDEDKALLTQWVEQNMPEFAGQAVTEIPAVVLEPTYQSISTHILGPKCTVCHNSFGSRGGVTVFDTYSQMVLNQLDLGGLFYNFASPEESFVVSRTVPGNPFGLMPPDNVGGVPDVTRIFPPLTTEERDVLTEWIRNKIPFE